VQTTDILARIERGRTRLLATQATEWFGTTAMHLHITPAPASANVATAATDGTHFFFNPAGIAPLNDGNLLWLWAHEVLHPCLGHNWRIPAFLAGDWHEWNVCTDLAINALIESVGIPVPGRLYDPQYVGKSAEEIARLRKRARDAQQQQQQQQQQPDPEQGNSDEDGQQDDSQQGDSDEQEQSESGDDAQDGDGSQTDPQGQDDGTDSEQGTDDDPAAGDDAGTEADSSNGDGTGGTGQDGPSNEYGLEPGDDLLPAPTPSADDADQPMTETDWQQATEFAAAVARKAGAMPGNVDRSLADCRQAVTDWRGILKEWVETQAPVDYTWQRANRRYLGQGLWLPGTRRENLPPVVVFVDTSGSIGTPELQAFGDNLQTILDECKPRTLTVAYVDTSVRHVQTFVPGDTVSLEARGGGGTAFQPAFDWLAEQIEDGSLEMPAGAIYLTDGYGYDVNELTEPPCRLMWAVVTGGTTDLPHGTIVDVVI